MTFSMQKFLRASSAVSYLPLASVNVWKSMHTGNELTVPVYVTPSDPSLTALADSSLNGTDGLLTICRNGTGWFKFRATILVTKLLCSRKKQT